LPLSASSRQLQLRWRAPLEKAILDTADGILQKLADEGIRIVGVLKFRIQKDGEKPTDDAGTLNLRLANMLEVALALRNFNEEAKAIGIVSRASAVVVTNPRANHLTKEGRKELFAQRYRLA
jgi:hypothetical protein